MTANSLPIQRAPPAITERPSCLHCGKTMRPYLWGVYEKIETATGFWNKEVARTWKGEYHGVQNLFCSNRCASSFGIQIARLFLDGAERVQLSAKANARLPGLRDARDIVRNIKMTSDLAPDE